MTGKAPTSTGSEKSFGPAKAEVMTAGCLTYHMTPKTVTRPSHAAALPGEIAAVQAMIGAHGPARAYELLGLARQTVDRIRGGLTVHRATLVQLRAALASLGVTAPAQPAPPTEPQPSQRESEGQP